MENGIIKRKTERGVGGNALPTQQNKNFVELEGGENGINRSSGVFWTVFNVLWTPQLFASWFPIFADDLSFSIDYD